jgi:hypothetical protein
LLRGGGRYRDAGYKGDAEKGGENAHEKME